MKFVIFGLTISSSWGNGHATLWRGLCRALARKGHYVVFFERDVPYYAGNRDCHDIPGGNLVLYPTWPDVLTRARRDVADADVTIVTSFCPDATEAAELVLSHATSIRLFYDLDTPVTLSHIRRGEAVPYVPWSDLSEFDLVLSYTGGRALDELQRTLHAKRVAPLYGHVDPDIHRPVPSEPSYRSDLSYLGTYAADRQGAVEALFIEPARRLPQRKFLIGGAQYPHDFPWTDNIYFVRHLPPNQHPAFYSSSRLTLNVTRQAMAEMGYCPSGRLFEAAACGTAILSDHWEGLDQFFAPDQEILVARTTDHALSAVNLDPTDILRIGKAARERTLDEHTSERRAVELLAAIADARSPVATTHPIIEPMEA